MAEPIYPREGGCICGKVRYRMKTSPLITHCCHCYRCQKKTSSSFIINALIEADRVESIGAEEPEQDISISEDYGNSLLRRCHTCLAVVWHTLEADSGAMKFVRVSTLDEAWRCPPDVHIYTASKQAWVVIPKGAKTFEDHYPSRNGVWSEESLERVKALYIGKKDLSERLAEDSPSAGKLPQGTEATVDIEDR